MILILVRSIFGSIASLLENQSRDLGYPPDVITIHRAMNKAARDFYEAITGVLNFGQLVEGLGDIKLVPNKPYTYLFKGTEVEFHSSKYIQECNDPLSYLMQDLSKVVGATVGHNQTIPYWMQSYVYQTLAFTALYEVSPLLTNPFVHYLLDQQPDDKTPDPLNLNFAGYDEPFAQNDNEPEPEPDDETFRYGDKILIVCPHVREFLNNSDPAFVRAMLRHYVNKALKQSGGSSPGVLIV